MYVIIDITTPPTASLSLFNLYVALSRSSGRATIRLLHDFEDRIFLKRHDEELLNEDEMLENQNEVTCEWYRRVVKT